MSTAADFEKRLHHDIELYGWHVIQVAEDEQGPAFGHSIGLYHTFDHPEILIVGLELEAIHALINKMGDAIREGTQFQSGQFYSNLFKGINCYFTSVDPAFYQEYVGYAELFYKNISFPVLQCIYPTLSGIYPWESEWPAELKSIQPLLGNSPNS